VSPFLERLEEMFIVLERILFASLFAIGVVFLEKRSGKQRRITGDLIIKKPVRQLLTGY
jgi:hypothetical protein